MIDLETLSTRKDCAVKVFSAMLFDRSQKFPSVKNSTYFYRKISQKSCDELKLHVDPKTIKWWDEQSPKMKEEMFSNESQREDLTKVLEDFNEWWNKHNCRYPWSQGATFDIAILEQLYSLCELSTPWKFYDTRDTRTIYDLAGVKPWDLPKGNNHHALHDCHRQIWGVKESLRKLGK